jgi:hypothetical protein
VFDPPAYDYIPPAIKVEMPPTLVFQEETISHGSFTFEYRFNFWESLIASSLGMSQTLVDRAKAAVENTINGWFNSWKDQIPNFRNPGRLSTSQPELLQPLGIFGILPRPPRLCPRSNLKVSYERGVLVPTPASSLQPPAVTVDPPPFAFKEPAKFTVEEIKGRVVVQGGNAFEDGGDTSSLNGEGSAESGLPTTATNRAVHDGVKEGRPVFKQDEVEGVPLTDTYLSLEGLGLQIAEAGFVPKIDGDVPWQTEDGQVAVRSFGVLMQNVENVEVRLANPSDPNRVGTTC